MTLKEIEKIAPEFFSTKPVAKLSDGETIDKWLSSYYRNNAKNAYIGINKAEFKLSYEQFASIYHYTGSGYEKLNAYLNGVKEIDSEAEVLFNSVKSLLNQSLEQLPKAREKRLYRWLNLSNELLEQYQVGKEIKLPAFTSTTYDKDKKLT
ncbi:hypothetical protein NKT77_02955 [Moraxella sp. FZLJ2107]|uniref:ADP-ribosyltransferase n=1 Tax=unclassified Moraxella TaxID=2685852 RepID=UPI0020C89010|nr:MULTISPECIES: ADP-ribosyltransferase [unclassified Moraxella]UTO05627.1 hypothetical protein NKT77_02955 [Moraxella sp. FZLJ2107]UTO22363.1 hypothetical protein NKU06_11260 [Moraxella sp. FZLJ2109]